MISTLVERHLRTAESELGESMDFLRDIYRASPAAYLKYVLFMPMSAHHRSLPAAVLHVARLTASLEEDCGSCAQIAINQALKDGIDPEMLNALVHGRPERLPDELIDVHLFVRAVITHNSREAELRQTMASRYGPAGMVDLAFAIAGARVYPTVKRVFGHGESCARLRVDARAA